MIYMAGGIAYTLVHDYKSGWNPEAFRERFSEVLERYDYVVGDWGYNQLRLKGFFREPQPKASRDAVITSLIDYINEYCNFGCAYFVLEKLDPSAIPADAVIFSSPEPAEPAAVETPAEEGAEAAADPAAAATNGAAATNAAPAANPSAPLLRWPLKERPGGRVPGTSPSAVARAVSEGAERRAAAAAQAGGGSKADSLFGRGYPDGGGSRSKGGSDSSQGRERRNNGNQGHHNNHGGSRQGHGNSSSGGGSERRHNGQDRKQGGGNHHRNNSNHHANHSSGKDQQDRSNGAGGEARASIAAGAEGEHSSRQSGGGGRWAGKNRRRGGFHGKPNRPRQDGAPRAGGGNGPRSEAGHTGGER